MINNLPIIKTMSAPSSASMDARFDGPLCGWSLNRENTRQEIMNSYGLMKPFSNLINYSCDHLLAGVVT
jgi:hypothetical protein